MELIVEKVPMGSNRHSDPHVVVGLHGVVEFRTAAGDFLDVLRSLGSARPAEDLLDPRQGLPRNPVEFRLKGPAGSFRDVGVVRGERTELPSDLRERDFLALQDDKGSGHLAPAENQQDQGGGCKDGDDEDRRNQVQESTPRAGAGTGRCTK